MRELALAAVVVIALCPPAFARKDCMREIVWPAEMGGLKFAANRA